MHVITIYDNRTHTAPALNTGRYYHAATLFDDKIVVCGGMNGEIRTDFLNTCEQLPVNSSGLWTSKWQAFASLPEVLEAGCLLVANSEVSDYENKIEGFSHFAALLLCWHWEN